MIDQSTARALFTYCPVKGELRWRNGRLAGRVLQGYIRVRVYGHEYGAHRIIWAHVHGGQVPREIDHIDGNPRNNRIENLRPATRSQNMANTKLSTRNSTGYKGVRWCAGRNKFRASICNNGAPKHLGYFDTAEKAHAAYAVAAAHVFGEYARAA